MSITVTLEVILGVVVLTTLLFVLAAALYRLHFVRRSSIPVLLSLGPGQRFRHGSIRFYGDSAAYYRLLSLRFGPDLRIERRSITLGSRRAPTETELDVAEVDEVVVPLSGNDRLGAAIHVSLCLDQQALTALQSWVEACSTDQVRRKGTK